MFGLAVFCRSMLTDEQRKKIAALRAALDALKSDPDLFWKATAPLILAGIEAADLDKAAEIALQKVQDGDILGAVTTLRRIASWKAGIALRIAESEEELRILPQPPENPKAGLKWPKSVQ